MIARYFKAGIFILGMSVIIPFFLFDKEIGYFVVSRYFGLVNGREIVVGGISVPVPDLWYITEINKNKVRLSRIPDEGSDVVVGIIEFGAAKDFLDDIPEVRDKIYSNQILPIDYIDQHAVYEFLFDIPCSNIEGACYHAKLLVPDMGLNITVSNFGKSQVGVVNEIIDAFSEAGS